MNSSSSRTMRQASLRGGGLATILAAILALVLVTGPAAVGKWGLGCSIHATCMGRTSLGL